MKPNVMNPKCSGNRMVPAIVQKHRVHAVFVDRKHRCNSSLHQGRPDYYGCECPPQIATVFPQRLPLDRCFAVQDRSNIAHRRPIRYSRLSTIEPSVHEEPLTEPEENGAQHRDAFRRCDDDTDT
jgi:hypothetical protein